VTGSTPPRWKPPSAACSNSPISARPTTRRGATGPSLPATDWPRNRHPTLWITVLIDLPRTR
jgi:hypothetical protein